MRWGMVIDLQRCIGCWACTIACKQEHFLPKGVFWNRVITSETGKYPNVRKEILPVMCNHCQDPACVKVCPTRATRQRADGIVVVDYDKCMGCRYCLVACPYQQRTFYREGEANYFPGQGRTELEQLGPQLYPLQNGTVIKCTFCVERIETGLRKNLRPGLDREATPACVNACVPKARVFGDLDDPESQLAALIREKKARPLHPEFGTEPCVYYINI